LDNFNFSQAWSGFKDNCSYTAGVAADYTINSPRFMGGVQAVGGACETVLGGLTAGASAPTGIGPVVGGAVMAHGLDHFFTGCKQMYTGNIQDTATLQLLQKTGMSHNTASLIDNGISTVGTIGCGGLTMAAGRSAVYKVPIPMESSLEYACSSAQAIRLRNSLIAREIAGGHAFEKHILHQGEFSGWIRTRTQFANHIENVINNPTALKQLRNNRTGYWQNSSRTVVVHNPKAMDGGTSFQPADGLLYFLNDLR
jgi:filamentous hemagglutinin